MQKESSLVEKRLRTILKDRIFISLVLGGLLLNIAILIAIKIFVNFDQTAFILHYNVFFGIDKISFEFQENPLDLFSVPIGSMIIWTTNLIISFFLYLTSLREQLQYVEADKGGVSEKEASYKEGNKNLYPKILGAYLLLTSALVVAIVIGIYVLAIILVNK